MSSLAVRALVCLLAAAALSAAGIRLGYVMADKACQAAQNQARQSAAELHRAAAIAGSRAEKTSVQRARSTQAVFDGISQGAILYAQSHPVATDVANNCHLDADGLRLWAAANANAGALPAAERDAGLRGAAAADERGADGSVDQPPGRRQGLSPVPGSPPGADRLAGERP